MVDNNTKIQTNDEFNQLQAAKDLAEVSTILGKKKTVKEAYEEIENFSLNEKEDYRPNQKTN